MVQIHPAQYLVSWQNGYCEDLQSPSDLVRFQAVPIYLFQIHMDTKTRELIIWCMEDPEYFWPMIWWLLEVYAVKNTEQCEKLLQFLLEYLPCLWCREHFKINYEPYNESFWSYFDYIIYLHNKVATMLWKKTYTPEERMEELLERFVS